MISSSKLMRYSLLVLVALVALAAEPTPRPQAKVEVKVCVLAILATDQNDKVDKRVECIAKEVQKVDAKLTGFQIHKMLSKDIAVGGKGNFDLIDDQSVGVTVDRAPGRIVEAAGEDRAAAVGRDHV